MPDTDFKEPNELIAANLQPTEQSVKLREEEVRQEQYRASTLPRLSARDSRGGEIVYAVATTKAILMPDLRGQSVRDVARSCAQLGMQVEAHGEGRVVKQSPEPGAELRPGQTIYVDFDKRQ
jgi:beta-lactam-binding protein with PASTA domain